MMKLRALALLCLFWQLCATETAYREFKISLQPERLFEHLQKELPEKKKAKMLPAMLMLAGVQRIDLGVYLHSDGEYYPVAQIQAETEEKLTQILSNPLLAVALKKQSANQFVLTDVAVKAKGVTQYRDYLFTQKKHQLLVKPSFVTEEWKSPSTDFVGNEFLQLSFGIPEKLAEKIVTAITQATEDVESAKFMMAFFGGPIKAVADELQRYKAFEFSLGVDQDKKRFLRIKQMMSNAAEAKKQMARSEFSEKNIKTSTMFYGLSTLKKKGDLSWATKRQKNDISLNVSWMAKDDETVGQSLFGSLMGSMGGKRKKASEIETKYVTIETFQPGVSGADFERQLRAALPKAMFPGHYWGNSDKPKATIEFEPPVFANSFLTDLEYEILSAVDAAGKSILRREEKKKNRFFSRLSFGLNSHSSQLKVPVLKGCTKEQLIKARLKIHGTIPVLAERFEFSKEEGDGVVKASSGVEVRLEKIDLDQVRFSYAGKGKVELRAYDKTGGALSRSQWSNSGLTRTYVFRGIVDRVEAIVVAKSKSFTMEIDVDLNKGKSLELPKQASSEVRVRYDRFSRTTYQDFTQKMPKVLWVQFQCFLFFLNMIC